MGYKNKFQQILQNNILWPQLNYVRNQLLKVKSIIENISTWLEVMRDTPKYSMGQIRNNNENEKIFKLNQNRRKQ